MPEDTEQPAEEVESVSTVGRTPGARPVEKRLRYQKAARRLAREAVRSSLALATLGLLITTVILAWVSTRGSHWKEAKDWLDVVLPAETGILGSALGFYFGSKDGRGKD